MTLSETLSNATFKHSGGIKDCPKCKHVMVIIKDNWACLSPECGYRESINLVVDSKEDTEQGTEIRLAGSLNGGDYHCQSGGSR